MLEEDFGVTPQPDAVMTSMILPEPLISSEESASDIARHILEYVFIRAYGCIYVFCL